MDSPLSPLEVAFHELGHALVGIDQGLTIYGIEFERVGNGWGGRAVVDDNVPDGLIPGFLLYVAAGPQASLLNCERNGAKVQGFDYWDRQQYGEVIEYAKGRGITGLLNYEEGSAAARTEVDRFWPRITELAPVLAEQKVMIRSELG